MITPILIESITGAVFDLLLEQTDAKGRIVSGIGRLTGQELDPIRRAFGNALKRTCDAFNETYPTAAAEGMDLSFLEKEGAHILAQFLNPYGEPNPQLLADAWIHSMPLQGRTLESSDKLELFSVTSSFLKILEKQLLSERALDEIHSTRSQIKNQQNIEAIANSLIPSDLRQINFVIIAMTKSQARELVSKKVFTNRRDDKQRKAYQELKKVLNRILKKYSIEDLVELYGSKPEDWRLLTLSNSLTIGEAIGSLLQTIPIKLSNRNSVERLNVRAIFASQEFLSDDFSIRSKAWTRLEDNCVVIIDAVSLFHPDIVQILIDSGFMTKSRIPLVILSPTIAENNPINELLKSYIESGIIRLSHALARFETQLDVLCEFGISSDIAFKRWLMSIFISESTQSIYNVDALWDAELPASTLERTDERIRSHIFRRASL